MEKSSLIESDMIIQSGAPHIADTFIEQFGFSPGIFVGIIDGRNIHQHMVSQRPSRKPKGIIKRAGQKSPHKLE
ncbi:MAG: hypothetical protein P4L67_03775 [Candidatus Pacebacteria bacterium]|nr:hypothetical protein [Candidatus Paceibacterota bacterium]